MCELETVCRVRTGREIDEIQGQGGEMCVGPEKEWVKREHWPTSVRDDAVRRRKVERRRTA